MYNLLFCKLFNCLSMHCQTISILALFEKVSFVKERIFFGVGKLDCLGQGGTIASSVFIFLRTKLCKEMYSDHVWLLIIVGQERKISCIL